MCATAAPQVSSVADLRKEQQSYIRLVKCLTEGTGCFLISSCFSLHPAGKLGKERGPACTSLSALTEKPGAALSELEAGHAGLLRAVFRHLKDKLWLQQDSNVLWVNTGSEQITPVSVADLGDFY